LKLSLVLCEGYGRRYDLSYDRFNIDPRPNVLALGRWVNHRGTKLLCGINLNYLSDDQVVDLQKNLPTILGDRNLRRRVRKLRGLAPQIFDRAYRTYDQDHVRIIAPGTLKFFREPKPQDIKDPLTKAVTPKQFVRPDVKTDKPEIKKPEDADKEIDNIDKDKQSLDLDRDEPDRDGKETLDKEIKDVDDQKIDSKIAHDKIKQIKPKQKGEVEKDKNFGKSDPGLDDQEIKPEDLDFEEGEEEQDSGIPSK